MRRIRCLLMSWLCCWIASGVAAHEDLQRVSDEVNALGVQVKALADQKVAVEAGSGARSYAARFADAEVYYTIGDYPNAALLLYGLAQPEYAQQAAHAKATQYLAESFFQMHNDLLANRYFHEVFVQQDKAAMPHAARRLIQIAERRQFADRVDEDLAVLRSLGPLPPDIAYAYAKNLVHRHRADLAYTIAGEIPQGDPDYLRARYLRAVALLDSKDLQGALQAFADLAQDPALQEPHRPEAKDIAVLAQLNQARLLFEVGKAVASEQAYAQVPKDTSVYNDVLFEQSWVALDAAEHAPDSDLRIDAYLRAQQSLELLLLDPNTGPLTAEAHILSANILMQLGRFDAAQTAYGEVVSTYKPMWDKVEALARSNRDVTHMFLSDPNAVEDPTVPPPLPPLAAHFAAQEKTLARTVELSRELEENETWLQECVALLERLSRALDVQERASMTLALQDTQGHHMELQERLTELTERLLTVQRDLVKPLLDAEHTQQLEAILAERAVMEPAYRKLPHTRDDYAGRDRALRARLNELQKQEYDLKWVMLAGKQQIAAMYKWMADHPETLTPQSAAAVEAELKTQGSSLESLEQARSALNAEIDEQRTLLTVVNASMSEEDALRQRYTDNLEREQTLLAAAAGGLTGADRASIERIDSLRSSLANDRDALAALRAQVSQAAKQGAQNARIGLQEQRDALALRREDMRTVRTTTTQVVPELTAQSLSRVRDKLRDIVVRGDVGMVDIAWALKERQDEQLNRQVSESHAEMQYLEQEAKDILKD